MEKPIGIGFINRVCPVHRCCLMDSGVVISGKTTPYLKTAEEIIPQSETCVFEDNEIEVCAAVYIAKVFQTEVDLDSCVMVGEFLHSRMANTPYRSKVCIKQRNITLFYADFRAIWSISHSRMEKLANHNTRIQINLSLKNLCYINSCAYFDFIILKYACFRLWNYFFGCF